MLIFFQNYDDSNDAHVDLAQINLLTFREYVGKMPFSDTKHKLIGTENAWMQNIDHYTQVSRIFCSRSNLRSLISSKCKTGLLTSFGISTVSCN